MQRIARIVFMLTVVVAISRPARAGETLRVNVATGGIESASQAFTSEIPGSVSDDGRFVVFASAASDLVPNDTNGSHCGLPPCADVFVHDRVLRTTERVSVSSSGIEGNSSSAASASISGDGRFVAFFSQASNLVSGDLNDQPDVFVRDRLLGTTELISVATDATQGNDLSYMAVISRDGRFVTFWSYADNLVAGDTNEQLDVFVRDRLAGTTERVSVSSTGAQTEAGRESYLADISADGRFVVFASDATNLVPDDTNEHPQDYPDTDVFVRDRLHGTTERVSVSSSGVEADGYSHYPSISADGRFVAFTSVAGNLVPGGPNVQCDPRPPFCFPKQEVFVHDRILGTTERVSELPDGERANDECGIFVSPEISADGRFVAFQCSATNLAPPRAGGVFVKDRWTGSLSIVDVASDGRPGNYPASEGIGISADGRFVSFGSYATDLVEGDTNETFDVFLHDRTCGDGVVDPSEQCDDGNRVPGDGCEPSCTVASCPGGLPLREARLDATNTGVLHGTTLVRFTGTLDLPILPAVPFAPQESGVQLVIEDLGRPSGSRVVVDLTTPNSSIPGGGRGSGCDPRDGWASSGRGRVQTYLNRSGSVDDPLCTTGSARGLRMLRLRDRRPSGRGVEFNGRLQAPRWEVVGPLRGTLILGTNADAGATGACGVARFTSDECSRRSERNESRCLNRGQATVTSP